MIIAWVVSVVAAFGLGYYLNHLIKRVETLEQAIKHKIDKPPQKPESQLIDPLDEMAEARYREEQMMKRLNPNG